MNVTLCDDLLKHGYRVAFAWWCIEQVLNTVEGEVFSAEQWNDISLPMEWCEAVELLPVLVRENRINGFHLIGQSSVSISLAENRRPNVWSVSRNSVINLKQHGISEKDVKNLAREYKQVWAADTWDDASFLSWALRKHYHSGGGDKPLLIDRHWTPSKRAVDQLLGEGVPEEVIRDCIPEFRLYWEEMGIPRASYHQTFVSYVRKTFREPSLKGVGEWSPSDHAFSAISKFGGERRLPELVASFRLYWAEVGEKFSNEKWEKLFIEYGSK